MPEYRLYKIKPDGHLAGPRTIVDRPDDTAILAEAKQRVDGLDIETWQSSRSNRHCRRCNTLRYHTIGRSPA
jgi:hypothetical protein